MTPVEHLFDRLGRINAALDQAVATPANVATWPVTGIQIPWDEWTALVEAIRSDPNA